MLIIRSLRTGAGLLILTALILLVVFTASGCSESDSPAAPGNATAPTLPDPAALAFDFSFFEDGASLEKSGSGVHENFVNAYLRAVVLQAMAELTLAPPVAAFSVALHTVPRVQDDGSWVWSYVWNGYRHPLRIALRGMPAGDRVEWEMRIGAGGDVPTALWFAGATSGNGRTGRWEFFDLDDPDQPVCGEVAWGDADDGRFLEFTSREPGSDGDVLRFLDADPDFAITLAPGAGGEPWFIRWSADGTGSLMVPDYNGGEEACWDRWQENTDCR